MRNYFQILEHLLCNFFTTILFSGPVYFALYIVNIGEFRDFLGDFFVGLFFLWPYTITILTISLLVLAAAFVYLQNLSIKKGRIFGLVGGLALSLPPLLLFVWFFIKYLFFSEPSYFGPQAPVIFAGALCVLFFIHGYWVGYLYRNNISYVKEARFKEDLVTFRKDPMSRLQGVGLGLWAIPSGFFIVALAIALSGLMKDSYKISPFIADAVMWLFFFLALSVPILYSGGCIRFNKKKNMPWLSWVMIFSPLSFFALWLWLVWLLKNT